MANYPQEFAQDAVWQSHTGHVNGLWFLPARPLRLNTNEWINEWITFPIKMSLVLWVVGWFLRQSLCCTHISRKTAGDFKAPVTDPPASRALSSLQQLEDRTNTELTLSKSGWTFKAKCIPRNLHKTFQVQKVNVKQSSYRPGQAKRVPRLHGNGTRWW